MAEQAVKTQGRLQAWTVEPIVIPESVSRAREDLRALLSIIDESMCILYQNTRSQKQ